MKIALTGASGFVGQHVLPLLQAHEGVEMMTLDIKDGIDVCDWESVKDIKADLFIHLANKSYVPDSYEHPRSFFDVNINSTLNILELARLNHARVLYFSSYVYGHPEYLPINEEHPIQEFNPYSATKIMCEQMCRSYAQDLKVPVAVFRPFNIYGTGQNVQFLLPMMVHQLPSGKIQVRDDRPKRDYIHIDDIASAVEFMAFAEWKETFAVYNIGSGESHSVREVAEMLMKLWPKSVEYVATGETRPNEVLDTVADISKLRAMGWTPRISLEDGLKEMINGLINDGMVE